MSKALARLGHILVYSATERTALLHVAGALGWAYALWGPYHILTRLPSLAALSQLSGGQAWPWALLWTISGVVSLWVLLWGNYAARAASSLLAGAMWAFTATTITLVAGPLPDTFLYAAMAGMCLLGSVQLWRGAHVV